VQPLERDQIRSLIQLAVDEDLAELTIQSEGETVRIRRTRATRPQPLTADGGCTPATAHSRTSLSRRSEEVKVEIEDNPNLVRIISPLVGIFYRAPTPGAPPFVTVGSLVEEGQTIGLVEAMKVFNEITAEVDGRVVAILAENEQLVQHGDTLVVIERMDVQ